MKRWLRLAWVMASNGSFVYLLLWISLVGPALEAAGKMFLSIPGPVHSTWFYILRDWKASYGAIPVGICILAAGAILELLRQPLAKYCNFVFYSAQIVFALLGAAGLTPTWGFNRLGFLTLFGGCATVVLVVDYVLYRDGSADHVVVAAASISA